MAYSAPTHYSSSKESRYPVTKTPVNVAAPTSSYGVYKALSHYSSGHPGVTAAYPPYTTASIPRSQPPSQYYPPSHSAYPPPHLASQSYDSHDASGYASSHSSASSVTMPPSSTNAMYPASPMRPYSCDQCALSFDRSHDLKRHRDSHSGAKPFECASCSRTFTRKDALKRHQSQKQCGIEEA